MHVDDLLAEIRTTRGLASLSPMDADRAAIHEAGHAYIAIMRHIGALRYVSLRAEANVGGTTEIILNQRALTQQDVLNLICQSLAGRAAESVLLSTVSTASGGPQDSDIARATTLAVNAAHSYCLTGSPLWLGTADAETSLRLLDTRPDIRTQTVSLLDDAYSDALATITAGRDAVSAIAAALKQHHMLTGKDVAAIIDKHHRPNDSQHKLFEERFTR